MALQLGVKECKTAPLDDDTVVEDDTVVDKPFDEAFGSTSESGILHAAPPISVIDSFEPAKIVSFSKTHQQEVNQHIEVSLDNSVVVPPGSTGRVDMHVVPDSTVVVVIFESSKPYPHDHPRTGSNRADNTTGLGSDNSFRSTSCTKILNNT